MRRNTDETIRDLERLAREGDRRAALKLLASWERTGEINLEPVALYSEADHDWLGRIELTFTTPRVGGVKRDVVFAMTFRDIPRLGLRTRGFIVNGSSGSVDDFAETLADLGSLSRVSDVNDVVARTKRRGAIDIGSIHWPEQVRSELRPAGRDFASSFEELHEVVRLVLDWFWAAPAYRAQLIEVLTKARLAYRAFRLSELRRQFEGLEEEAAAAVEDELTRRDGKLDFPPRDDETYERDEPEIMDTSGDCAHCGEGVTARTDGLCARCLEELASGTDDQIRSEEP